MNFSQKKREWRDGFGRGMKKKKNFFLIRENKKINKWTNEWGGVHGRGKKEVWDRGTDKKNNSVAKSTAS